MTSTFLFNLSKNISTNRFRRSLSAKTDSIWSWRFGITRPFRAKEQKFLLGNDLADIQKSIQSPPAENSKYTLTWKNESFITTRWKRVLMPYFFFRKSPHQQLAAASCLLDDPPSRLTSNATIISYLSHGQKAIRKMFESLGKGLVSTNVLSANALPLWFFHGTRMGHVLGSCMSTRSCHFFKLLTGIIWGCFLRTPRFILNPSKCWIPVL